MPGIGVQPARPGARDRLADRRRSRRPRPGVGQGSRRAAVRRARRQVVQPMADFLVTGGAGFIGSNYVRHVARQHRRDGHGARQAHVRRQPGVARRAARPIAARSSQGDICDADARRHASSPTTTPSSTSPPSRTTTTRCADPSPFVQTNLIGTFTLLEAVRKPTACATTTSRPTRSTATSSSTTRRASRETTPYNPSSPYSATKAGSDLLVRAWVRSFGVRGDDQQLLEQLRAVPARREVHPAPDHQRARRRPAEAVRRRAERARLDPRRRPQRGRARDPERGRPGETYLIGADGEQNNQQVVEMILELLGQPGRRLRPRHRPRRVTTCATRSTATKLRTELGWRPRYERLRRPAWRQTIDWYRANEAWWRPQKAATEAKYAAHGPVTDAAARHRRRRPARPRRRGRARPRRGDDVVGADHAALDVTDRDAVLGAITSWRPDAVVHCAAWTAVDACEARSRAGVRRQRRWPCAGSPRRATASAPTSCTCRPTTSSTARSTGRTTSGTRRTRSVSTGARSWRGYNEVGVSLLSSALLLNNTLLPK